eukprot:191196_1
MTKALGALNKDLWLSEAEKKRHASELVELDRIATSEPIPTSLSALNNHPLYCIEKWVKKYEIIFPKTQILGKFGEFDVFPRTNLRVLHSADIWFREMRMVKSGAIPLKRVRPSAMSSKQEMTELFGKWQTDPWTPPRAVDGKVPKNIHGQVDLWTKDHMPGGCVQLPMPRVSISARKLGVHYAPCMTGFDVRKGRSFPVYEGIVVACENATKVIEHYFVAESTRRKRAEQKRASAVLGRWVRLVKGALERTRILEENRLPEERLSQIPSSSPSLGSSQISSHHEHNFLNVSEKGRTVNKCNCGLQMTAEDI